MLDPTPWIVSTPGAQHSSEVARALAFSATQGATGVIGASSFRVTAQSTPNNTVAILPGVASAVSRYPGHVGQSYVLRNATTTNAAIAPTTSAGGRTDAVIARVDDVGLVSQAPADPTNYSYTKIEVIQGVPASLKYPSELNLNYPFVLLAKITIPASTATITDAMITNLREVVNGRETSVIRTIGIPSGQVSPITVNTAWPVGSNFPTAALYPASSRTVRVPEWATAMEIRAEWIGSAARAGAGGGSVWVTWGLNESDTSRKTRPGVWQTEDTNGRQNLVSVDSVAVEPDIRGKDIIFVPRGRRDSTTATPKMQMDEASSFVLTVRFFEKAD